jgi:Putative lumazine-binding
VTNSLPVVHRPLVLICAPLSALALAACGTTTSTASFKGAEHEVAQTIANLQSDVTGTEAKKVCANDLAAAVVSKLGGRGSCEKTVKDQLSEIDNTEMTVEKVTVSGTTATASVKSNYGGKKRVVTVSLAKEGGKWKIASIG